jgi:hypothetical protein
MHINNLFKEENMKTLKVINNRLNWLSAGFALAFIFLAWLEDEKEEKEIRKMADEYPISDITLLEGYPPEPTPYAKSFDDVYNYYEKKEQRNA